MLPCPVFCRCMRSRDEDELIAAAREELLARARTQLKRARSERLPE